MSKRSKRNHHTNNTHKYFIRGKDGTWIEHEHKSKPVNTTVINSTSPQKSFAQYDYSGYYAGGDFVQCKVDHNGDVVIWTFCRVDDSLEFTIGDVPGWKTGIKEADVVLDLNNNVSLNTRKLVLSAPSRFLGLNDLVKMPKAEIIKLDWPDYNSVDAPLGFWQELLRLFPKNGRIMITCHGGHGRSGTCLAALMIASGMHYKDAIKYVREVHCKKAIESKSQEEYLFDLGEEAGQTVTVEDVHEIEQAKSETAYYDKCQVCDERYETPSTFALCIECELDMRADFPLTGTSFSYCYRCGEDFDKPSDQETCEKCAVKFKDILPYAS